MHFCTAIVALQGDDMNKVHRSEYAPISWPEVEVILALHGPGSVSEIRPFISVEQDSRSEVERLRRIYGDIVVKDDPISGDPAVYPGRNPAVTMEASEYTRAPAGTRWMNPLSGLQEEITEESSYPVPKGPLVIDEFNTVTPGPRVMTYGDPRPGDPDTGATRPKRSVARPERAAKYDDGSDSPFAA